jgi:hypothetical protein
VTKGKNIVDLTWSGATSRDVEIWRDGVRRATTKNDGRHTDSLGTATGTFRYRVSHKGGTPISDEVAVTVA